ncbi:HAMP domain-containing histidine kinase [Vibrio sp.]|uniref:histidine kinase n=1 Tax=Vibrio viridaestus TaxID=2487322 RepID=A0A3N9TCX3_9VIBR|nr:HAMP domain-containing sensor histidine kinase [Vibrio viridaestus]MDC0609534.1 HAMP domain-containing histidine kinase [Vibrio sp.]RQW62011.1 sensor histidine kinase [Vibrio viridaestus]
MRIRKSMHIYLSCTIILVGTLTVVSFSTIAMNYFINGLDIAFRYTMELIGKDAQPPEHGHATFLDFDVAGSWNGVPSVIKETLDEPKGHLGFSKYILRKHWYESPEIATFAMRYVHSDGTVVYVTRAFSHMDETDPKIPFLTRIIVIGFIGVLIFGFCILFLLYQLNKPFDRLMGWTRKLNTENLTQPVPDFHYREINELANIIQSSLSSVQQTLERERKFISHASHELRTPISVVRSNTELLLKLMSKEGSSDKQKQVAERVLRASISMTELCDTLLWLNRREYKNLSRSSVDLGALIEQLTFELNYLIKNKEVTLSINAQHSSHTLSCILARIVLGNLIRNAFQHTYSGTIQINHKNDWVLIRNQNSEEFEEKASLGFGLGLELTKQIIKQYGWQYRVKEIPGGRIVFIRFS